ncbi:MAG: hypothetical protein ACOYI9_13690 [Candidatus Hydrogenedentales bacterium]|jgi:hypothetical protein
MAGFDLAVQRSGAAHGLRIDCGHVDFTANSSTVEVPCTLNTVFMGFGVIKTDNTENHSLICSCDNSVSDAGAVTFTRHGPYLGDTPTMNYILIGW